MDENKQILKNVFEKDSSAGRLQSLRLPRDLSLGSKPKKQYTPNLNVVRNKDKTKDFLKKVDQKRKDKPLHRERLDSKRFLQSTGVFSQGTGEMKRQNPYSERKYTFRDSSMVANIVMPTINRNTWNVNKKAEDMVLEELSNCDIDSDDEKMSFAPLTLAAQSAKNVKKEAVIIKKEDVHTVNAGVKTDHLMANLPEPFNSDLYSEENPALSVVKLPDSFAGKGLSDDPNVKKLFDYPLSEMLEGEIGKLIIRKSGKMEMQIGRITYDLSPENTFESKEELAIISDHNIESSITVLGSVLNNFVMFPDYNALLKRK